MAADGGWKRNVLHRMNEGYRAWGALKSVLSNRGLGIKEKKCLFEGVIVPTALYGAEAWGMRSAERKKLIFFKIYLLKRVGSPRLRESGIHPISPKTPAPQYQPIDRNKRKGKKVEDYSRDRAAWPIKKHWPCS